MRTGIVAGCVFGFILAGGAAALADGCPPVCEPCSADPAFIQRDTRSVVRATISWCQEPGIGREMP